jgi:rhodanese-related sulfurtransferase
MRRGAPIRAGLPFALLVLLGGCTTAGRADRVRRIPPAEARDHAQKNRALLVCPYARKDCPGTHLAGSITLEDLEARLPELPGDQKLIFACGCPGEATAAARAVDLQGRGFRNVAVIAGGFLAWIQAGYEVTTAPGARQ